MWRRCRRRSCICTSRERSGRARTVGLHPDLPLADFITDCAINGRGDGVVALGLAGTERGYPPERRIALEVCPTSNVCLGVYPSLAEHPLARLHAAGVRVTINTDTPSIFGTTLSSEAALLATAFGLSPSAIDEILLNGFEASFLPPEGRDQLTAWARQEFAAERSLTA
jgi:hypothetical protein